jgi:transcriptional regulator with XRE-family HTH domain
MKAFGEKLKKLRNEKNLTLQESAKQIGIKASTLSSYENGYRMPGLKTLIKLSSFYETSIDYLIGKETKNIDRGKLVKDIEEIEKQMIDIEKRIVDIKKYIKSGY